MANMSYCRWENTSKDMQDCINSMAEVDDVRAWFASLDQYEQEGVRRALRCAETLTAELGQELEGLI